MLKHNFPFAENPPPEMATAFKHVAALLLIFIAGFSSTGNTAAALKILGLFPHPAISHFHVFEPLMRGLAQAGHDVTVFSMFPQKQPLANYTDVVIPGDVLTAAIDLQVSSN